MLFEFCWPFDRLGFAHVYKHDLNASVGSRKSNAGHGHNLVFIHLSLEHGPHYESGRRFERSIMEALGPLGPVALTSCRLVGSLRPRNGEVVLRWLVAKQCRRDIICLCSMA